MILEIYTDGGSKGNPGPAAIGIVFFCGGKQIKTYREDIGVATNNIAEYKAVVRALEKVKDIKREMGSIQNIKVYSDSNLLTNQLMGRFKVKNAKIREFILQIRILEQENDLPITYNYIPRERNTIADDLVNNRYYQSC